MQRPVYLFSISSHPDAISVNSLDITFFKPDIDFSKYDYFIITSKQASKALQQYKKESYIDIPALCISQQSAKSYESLGGKVIGIGQGYGDSLEANIKKYPKDTKWLYLRAKIIASDFVQKCKKDAYNIDELIVYESECSKKILNTKVEDNAILIFTSPSSVQCFLKNSDIKTTHKVIVIGKTTAKALPESITYTIAQEPTIKSCFKHI